MRPLLGVICCTLPPAGDPRQGVAERYLHAGPFIGADLVLIPSVPQWQDAASLVRRLDGVFLTGSPSNVESARYGAEDPEAGPFDPARDTTALALLDAARAANRPVLGICRGFQEIAVAYGSTLRRDLGAGTASHHAGDTLPLAEKFAHCHDVRLAPGGALARATGRERITINSVHFQGVAALGPALRAEAASDDGLVEAVSEASGRVLAVQWHPEWDAPTDPVARVVLSMFGAMLRGATLDQAADQAGTGSRIASGAATAGASSGAD